MKRSICYWIEGPGRNAFHKALPDELKKLVVERTEYSNVFRVPHEEFDKLRDIDARARAAGFKPHWYAELELADDPIDDGRMYLLTAPLLGDAGFSFNGLRRASTCSTCGRDIVTAVPGDDEPRLQLNSEPSRRLFSVADGKARIMDAEWADELRHEGLMSGAALRPAKVSGSTRRYYVMSAQHDLGPSVYEPGDACPECGGARRGGYFPLFRRPDARVDVAFTRDYGPFTPLVSGRLGRALAHEPGIGLQLMGWYPDDLELARVPRLETA